MIPPATTVQDDSGDKEDERDQDEAPKSPTMSANQQETKVGTIPRLFPPQHGFNSRMQVLETGQSKGTSVKRSTASSAAIL